MAPFTMAELEEIQGLLQIAVGDATASLMFEGGNPAKIPVLQNALNKTSALIDSKKADQEIIAETNAPVESIRLIPGQPYRVVHQGHRLDGERVIFERLEYSGIGGEKQSTRLWVLAGISKVVEVPAGSLYPCR